MKVDIHPRAVEGAGPHEDIRKESTRTGDVRQAAAIRSAAPWRMYRVLSVALVWSDVLCLAAALLGSYFMLFGAIPLSGDYLIVMAAAAGVWVMTFRAYSLYAPWRMSRMDEFRRVVSATSVGVVFIILASFWSDSHLSRPWVGLTWCLALILELLGRRFWAGFITRLRETGELKLRTLVVGRGNEALDLATSLTERSAGFSPVGYVTAERELAGATSLPLLGTIDDLASIIYDVRADCIFVENRSVHEKDILKVSQAARQMGAEVWLSANMPEMLTSRLGVQPLAGTMAISLRPVKLTGPQTVLKRAFDLLAGSIGFLLISPLLVAIAVAVKATSPGPALFRQHRVTKGGHIFTMYKFRTMQQDTTERLRLEGVDAGAAFFKMGEDDPRITKVGRVLRKLSLDELPQLLNVLRGEMSLVGPRPLPCEQVANNLELLGPRHEVSAGMTGWWQIQGRSDVDSIEAVRLDLFYIENWSLALDLYVLLKTFGAVLAKRGAR